MHPHPLTLGAALLALGASTTAQAPAEGSPPPHPVADAVAATAAAMRPYTEELPGTELTLELVPIPGGRFSMGSPEDEPERRKGEGPLHEVEVAPFWMARHEVTWDLYQVFMLKLDRDLRERGLAQAVTQDAWADAVSRPTPPYVAMDFGMGIEGYPAVCMTQFAAKQFTRWLSMKTGRFYRLPTEAEWELACRSGTQSAYSFGDDPAALSEHAWYAANSGGAYHPVGTKEPNAFGLHDMHGNVAEWVLDGFDRSFYATLEGGTSRDPVDWPEKLYPRVVRGGSWVDAADRLRSAARSGSHKGWKTQDPQLPKSIWYHTDAAFVGFRVVRPFLEPSEEERERYWEAGLTSIDRVLERQRAGGR